MGHATPGCAAPALPLGQRRAWGGGAATAREAPVAGSPWAGYQRGEVAGGQGFEPRLTDPESAVLPLDDPPMCCPDSVPYLASLWPRQDTLASHHPLYRRRMGGASAHDAP